MDTRVVVRRANFPDVPGLWKTYDHRFKRIVFAFAQEVPSLPAGNLNIRRHLPMSSPTDVVWENFTRISYDDSTLRDKRRIADDTMTEWCRAILDGEEDMFVAHRNFPQWKLAVFQEQPTTSAQAATAATISNTIDPAAE